ncbi:MAG: cytidylate kinase-like family protein [Gemmatimonadetes bacterium]|nr:cytidylate kinase-like family protein [Gemmatimonadota bacterium]
MARSVAVVTITRQYGAGGSSVAQRVAAALGWTVIDNEFVNEVAARAGLPVEAVAAKEERVPSLMERMVRALADASPETFVPAPSPGETADEETIVAMTERVIAEAADHGRVVLVGRGAQAYLARAREADALHVYVVAPREVRIREIAARLGLGEKEAASALDATDADRDRYVARHYQRRRQDPVNYHLVLNTGWLGYDGAADLIVASARRRGWS